MNYQLRAEYKKWNSIDYDFIYKMILIFITFCAMCVAVAIIIAKLQVVIMTNYENYKLAKDVNTEFRKLYTMQDEFGERLINDKQIKELKLIYDSEELNKQHETIINASAKLAKKICPIGTYIYIEDTREVVRVKGYYGYQADTYEGINFMTTEDKWHTLSYWEYRTLGGKY